MAAEVIRRPEPSRAPAFALSAFSSLATKQPRTNRLATWMLDPDAPFGEQPPAKRVQVVLCSVHEFDSHFKQVKPVNNILALIARLALRNGYAIISQITSESYRQSHGGRGSHSGRRHSGATGQNTPGSTVPLGAGNVGGGPSKRTMERGGGGGSEGNPNKKPKLLNEPQDSGVYRCIVFELNQRSPERNENHPCKGLQFRNLESAKSHHLRMHVGHMQCERCFIRKGTTTDINKHRTTGCSPPAAKIRQEVIDHGENVRKVKTWDDLRRQVAPDGEIQYDMASNVDKLAWPLPDEDKSPVEQLLLQYFPDFPDFPEIPEAPELEEGGFSDRSFRELNDRYGCPSCAPGGTNHDPNALSGTVNPLHPLKPNPDSGISTFGGQSSQRGTEVRYSQLSEVRNRTSTGAGEGITSENEAPKHPSLKLLHMVNQVTEAFLECNQDPGMGREMAQLSALNLTIRMPDNILQVFAQAYQRRVEQAREAQAHSRPRGGKGKEGEQHWSVVDGD